MPIVNMENLKKFEGKMQQMVDQNMNIGDIANKFYEEYDFTPVQFDALASGNPDLMDKVKENRLSELADKIQKGSALYQDNYVGELVLPVKDVLYENTFHKGMSIDSPVVFSRYETAFAKEHINEVMLKLENNLANQQKRFEEIVRDNGEEYKLQTAEYLASKDVQIIEGSDIVLQAEKEAQHETPSVTISNDNEVMGIGLKDIPVIDAVVTKVLVDKTDYSDRG